MTLTNRIKAFQARHGLRPDGIVGDKTWTRVEDLEADAVTQPQRPSVKPRRGFSPQWIVIHCSGSTGRTIDDIRRYHVSKGWSDIGYHKVIHEDGLVHVGRPEWKPGAHAKGANDASLAVCLIGNFNGAPPPPHMLRARCTRCSAASRAAPRAYT